jgi:hypothetical protein
MLVSGGAKRKSSRASKKMGKGVSGGKRHGYSKKMAKGAAASKKKSKKAKKAKKSKKSRR